PAESVRLTDSVLHFWEALGDWKRGHLSLPNQIVLVLYRHLDPAEQAVYTQLYAMSWGYGKPDCFCNLATLAVRSGMGTTATGQAIKRLVSKGLIEKSAVQLGKGYDQGITYRLPLPDRLVESVRLTRSGRQTDSTDKKDLDQKQIKKGITAGDCPDCNGTFWVYPNGPEGGVKKCSHPKLKRMGK
ncbi:MAG: helix-turn-helix domain-containing protein, partial [Acidobacteriota bacterium]|nr:helix-turn-helix domain-containing protein [Acidobacteriota bacterium]